MRRPGCCGEQELLFLSRRRINMTAGSNAGRALSGGYRTSKKKPDVKTYTDAPWDVADGRRTELCEKCAGRAAAPASQCAWLRRFTASIGAKCANEFFTASHLACRLLLPLNTQGGRRRVGCPWTRTMGGKEQEKRRSFVCTEGQLS
ncbi:hypothetical protein MRX96_011624 [Rhipicephalus microplus]